MDEFDMPEQPTTWAVVIAALSQVPIAIQGAFMSFIIALLRLTYDGRENSWARKLLEAALCGFLALASGGILDWMGLDGKTMLIPVSAVIGFIGVEGLRELARKYVGFEANRRAEDKVKKDD